MEEAETGEIIWILKDEIGLTEDIGVLSQEPDPEEVYIYPLKNTVCLTKKY